jgi:hypothetical protein
MACRAMAMRRMAETAIKFFPNCLFILVLCTTGLKSIGADTFYDNPSQSNPCGFGFTWVVFYTCKFQLQGDTVSDLFESWMVHRIFSLSSHSSICLGACGVVNKSHYPTIKL